MNIKEAKKGNVLYSYLNPLILKKILKSFNDLVHRFMSVFSLQVRKSSRIAKMDHEVSASHTQYVSQPYNPNELCRFS